MPSARKTASVDWNSVSPDFIREIQRQGELIVSEQRDTANSIDQRAGALAALTTAAASLLFVTLALRDPEAPPLGSALWVLAGMILGWFASAFLAALALLPRRSRAAGAWPHTWFDALASEKRTERQLLGDAVVKLEDVCATNRLNNQRRIVWLKVALWIAAVPPFIALAATAAVTLAALEVDLVAKALACLRAPL